MNAFGLVLVRRRDNFDNLVAREFEFGNIHRAAVHQVGIEHTQNGLVSDDEQVVLLTLKLENDWLEADGEVMVRLETCVNRGELVKETLKWHGRVNVCDWGRLTSARG